MIILAQQPFPVAHLFIIIFRNRFQMLDNGQMLGAHALTLAAADTVSRFPRRAGQLFIKALVGCPALCLRHPHIFIVKRKILGDRDLHVAAVCTIGSAGTRDSYGRADDIGGLLYQLLFRWIQGFKIFHVVCIVFQLSHTAHAGQYHHHVI